jgi:integrase
MPLKLTRRHGSPFWYIRGSIRGRRVDESTGVVERGAAEEILVKRAAEVLTRSIHGEAVSRTFGEAALRYIENGGDAGSLSVILTHIGKKPVGSINQDEIEGLAKKMYPKAAPATVNRKVYTPVVAVLHHAARINWRGKPVVERPEAPAGRVRWITETEAEALLKAVSAHLRPLVIFLLATGARLSEALYLDWRDVDLDRRHVAFLDTKNGEDRGVPLHPRAVAALEALTHRKGAVFRRPDGKPYEERVGGGGQVKTAWATMLKRAEISDFTPHDCRHTWATWHYRANRDLLSLMKLGGWKTMAMVERYAHVNTSQLAPGINAIWEQKVAEVPPISPTSETSSQSVPS